MKIGIKINRKNINEKILKEKVFEVLNNNDFYKNINNLKIKFNEREANKEALKEIKAFLSYINH